MDNKQKQHKRAQKYQRFDQTQMQFLVNFQVKESEPPDLSYQRKSRTKSNNNYLENSKRQKMYMKSKFQFVTLLENKKDEKCDFVEWDDIVQVIFPTTTEIICPICMNDDKQLVAPQITTCGHIYCLPCFLRHALISKTRNHCPFCGEIAIKEDLRSVKIIQLIPTLKGQTINLVQVLKLKSSPLLYSAVSKGETKEFSRIIHVNKSYIQKEVINEELSQLDYVSSQELDSIPQIQESIGIVKEKQEQHKLAKQEEPKIFFQHLDNHFLKDENQFYILFQEIQGQLEYLHPICNKYMERSFSKTSMPLTIESKIIAIDAVTLTENNKQRYKFLSHLPVYTEVKFLEVDMFYILQRDDYEDFYDEMFDYRDRQKDQTQDGRKKQQIQPRKNSKSSGNQVINNSIQPVQEQGDFNENDFFPDLPVVTSVRKQSELVQPEIIQKEIRKISHEQTIKKEIDDYPLLFQPSNVPETHSNDLSESNETAIMGFTPDQKNDKLKSNQQSSSNNYWDQQTSNIKQPEQHIKAKVTKYTGKADENLKPKIDDEEKIMQFQEIVKKKGKKKKVYIIPSGLQFG